MHIPFAQRRVEGREVTREGGYLDGGDEHIARREGRDPWCQDIRIRERKSEGLRDI
jgi:hypothetical protein